MPDVEIGQVAQAAAAASEAQATDQAAAAVVQAAAAVEIAKTNAEAAVEIAKEDTKRAEAIATVQPPLEPTLEEILACLHRMESKMERHDAMCDLIDRAGEIMMVESSSVKPESSATTTDSDKSTLPTTPAAGEQKSTPPGEATKPAAPTEAQVTAQVTGTKQRRGFFRMLGFGMHKEP